jgi:hypothetical protein
MIGSCGKDGGLLLHRMRRFKSGSQLGVEAVGGGVGGGGGNNSGNYSGNNNNNNGINNNNVQIGPESAMLEHESSTTLDTNGSDIWRLAWNVTGTVLAASGDNGVVQVWKTDFSGNFKCVTEV